MSKRYKKDRQVDGWPVVDTKEKSVLSTNAIVERLNEQERQINEMQKLLSDMANNAVFQRLHEIASKQA
ncbi:hypothetical protein [Halomonas sp. BC2]|uniref:hypothetical protein n=1 Tax=Halomonas sp. BC2 TaxID=1670449 RepID=UPI0009BEF042|nr:hypothetical protein [Halomonas sp. BC2]